MATQMQGTTGMRGYKRPRYVDQINIQRQFLPQMIANKDTKENQAKQLALRQKELDLMQQGNLQSQSAAAAELELGRKRFAWEKEASKKGAGLEAMKFGLNIGTGGFGNKAQVTTGGKLPFELGQQPYLRNTPSKGGFLDKASNLWDKVGTTANKFGGVGNLAGSGLAGWGAASAFGGNSMAKKMLFGAGAGLLNSFLSGGMKGNFYGNLGGAGMGLLGSLFS